MDFHSNSLFPGLLFVHYISLDISVFTWVRISLRKKPAVLFVGIHGYRNRGFMRMLYSPAAHGGRSLPMGWTYLQKYMQYIWRSVGLTAAAGEAVMHAMMEGRKESWEIYKDML